MPTTTPYCHFFIFLVFSIWTPMIPMVGHFILSQNSQRFSCFPFYFFCTPTGFHLFPSFYLHLISSFSVSVILSLLSFKVLLISVKSLIIITWLFFISSRSMVNRFISSQSRSPVYLLSTSLSFQDFGHRWYHYSELFLGKSFYLLFFCLLWWLLIIYLHCLPISLSFCLV